MWYRKQTILICSLWIFVLIFTPRAEGEVFPGGVPTHYPTPYWNRGGDLTTTHLFVGSTPIATIEASATGAPKLFWNHVDHRGSTRLVTDFLGHVVEATDYDAFGNLASDIPFIHREQRKFTGHEFDPSTDYTYAKARYLDTESARFLSQDPAFWSLPTEILADPQQLNSYAYARNNPLRYVDPDGKLNIGIPGTWASDDVISDPTFTAIFEKYFKDFAKLGGGPANYIYPGPLKDNKASRSAAAEGIMEVIRGHQFSTGETLNIVGHSHGGTVAALLSQMSERKIDNLVTLGTPNRSDYKFNEDNIGTHIQGFSMIDGVQKLAGGQLATTQVLLGAVGLLGCGLPCAVGGALVGERIGWGEFGPTIRTFGGHVIDVNVTREAGGNIKTSHSNVFRASGVWQRIHDYLIP